MRFSTRAIHAGQEPDPATGATIPPICQSSTFTQRGIGEHLGYEYSRSGNPTRAALEECLAALEGAAHGLAFASGLAAETAVLSLLSPGERIVATHDLYGGTRRLFDSVLRPLGIETVYVDGNNEAAVSAALDGRARLLWTESPSNPLLRVYDIASLAKAAHAARALLVVDNTFATPYLQQPLSLDADVVVHSTTKYIGGHSDAVGGAVLTNNADVHDHVAFYQNAAGGVPGPFDAWLILRGVKTLAVRMDRHCANARRVAAFLEDRPSVRAVHYPGSAASPGRAIAERQMSDFGGMLSFEIDGGRRAANAFYQALRVFSLAESLGGVESLACHPATMTHAAVPPDERERLGITDGLVRLSVGIEDVEDLLEDLDQALDAAGR